MCVVSGTCAKILTKLLIFVSYLCCWHFLFFLQNVVVDNNNINHYLLPTQRKNNSYSSTYPETTLSRSGQASVSNESLTKSSHEVKCDSLNTRSDLCSLGLPPPPPPPLDRTFCCCSIIYACSP